MPRMKSASVIRKQQSGTQNVVSGADFSPAQVYAGDRIQQNQAVVDCCRTVMAIVCGCACGVRLRLRLSSALRMCVFEQFATIIVKLSLRGSSNRFVHAFVHAVCGNAWLNGR